MDFRKLKDFIDFYLPMLGVPGSDTIIYKDHQEIFRHTSGFDSIKNRTPMRRDALYNIFSCTKISTCVAIMQLVERGQILLTDPVHVYLPEYKNLTVANYDSDGSVASIEDSKKTMLIKHLLSMTSGLDYNLNRPAIRALIDSNCDNLTTRDFVKSIALDPLGFEPGTHFCYGLSHDVLGGIVEVVSGLSLEEYMQKNIFQPLGMKDTTFKITNLNYGRIAAQYDYDSVGRCANEIQRDTNVFRFGNNYYSGGAGLISSVDDYILLADALANDGVGKNGNRILSSGAVKLLSTPALDGDAAKDYDSYNHFGYSYCYGVRNMTNPGLAGSLAPKGLFGWDGMKMCLCFSDPENRIGIFHAEHINGLNPIIIPRLVNVIYSCI